MADGNWLTAGFALLLGAWAPIAYAGESPPHGPSPQVEHWAICKVGGLPIPGKTVPRGPGGRRAYFSGVFRASVNQADIGAAFGAFLAQRYGVAANVTGQCASTTSQADAEKLLENWKASDAKFNYGGERIETGWQYSPPGTAPSPARP